jgi:hypothetical protein
MLPGESMARIGLSGDTVKARISVGQYKVRRFK